MMRRISGYSAPLRSVDEAESLVLGDDSGYKRGIYQVLVLVALTSLPNPPESLARSQDLAHPKAQEHYPQTKSCLCIAYWLLFEDV